MNIFQCISRLIIRLWPSRPDAFSKIRCQITHSLSDIGITDQKCKRNSCTAQKGKPDTPQKSIRRTHESSQCTEYFNITWTKHSKIKHPPEIASGTRAPGTNLIRPAKPLFQKQYPAPARREHKIQLFLTFIL